MADDIIITTRQREGGREEKGKARKGDCSFHSYIFVCLFFCNFEFDWFTFIASLNPAAAAATTGEEPRNDLSRQKATSDERESYSIYLLLLLISISFSLLLDSVGQ